jgi:type II secretory pathway pseudopilin PulG
MQRVPDRRPRLHRTVSDGGRASALRTTWSRVNARREARRPGGREEDGFTLVELLVAFTALVVLITVVGTAITTYLNVANNVISSYNATDQLLPSSVIIQRLIRNEVEPSPTTSATSAVCPTANAPCPPFLLGTSSTAYSTAFYANVGDPNGPAKIVMSSSAPAKCTTCTFYTSTFTVTEYHANAYSSGNPNGSCPLAANNNLSGTCTWSSNGTILVDVLGVVNGQASLHDPNLPIFTYNTLNPSTSVYTPNTPVSSFATGTCTSVSACPADNVQSVEVDLEVDVPGTPIQANDFIVYRLSSFSYLYSPLVG